MNNPAFMICFVLIFLFSIYLGFVVGNSLGERALSTRAYWLWHVAMVILCVVLTVLLSPFLLLTVTPLGFLGGTIAGLKMGFGESVGPWKLLDRFFNVNRAQRWAAKTGSAARARQRRKKGESEPDLISISPAQKTNASDEHSRSRKKR